MGFENFYENYLTYTDPTYASCTVYHDQYLSMFSTNKSFSFIIGNRHQMCACKCSHLARVHLFQWFSTSIAWRPASNAQHHFQRDPIPFHGYVCTKNGVPQNVFFQWNRIRLVSQCETESPRNVPWQIDEWHKNVQSLRWCIGFSGNFPSSPHLTKMASRPHLESRPQGWNHWSISVVCYHLSFSPLCHHWNQRLNRRRCFTRHTGFGGLSL